MTSIVVKILGCGGSGGVPRIGHDWGNCDPNEPKNYRRRASILVSNVETGQNLLVDTSPDLRGQLLDAGVGQIDAVIWTHEHADHTHGIDDLRPLMQKLGRPVPGFTDSSTKAELLQRFAYVFVPDSQSGYRPLADLTVLAGDDRIIGLRVVSFPQSHGDSSSLGLRIGNFAYSTDVNFLSDGVLAQLTGLDLWLVDCLGYEPHPTHAHLSLVKDWAEKIRPKRVVLTHLSHRLDYHTLSQQIPDHWSVAYDGMELKV